MDENIKNDYNIDDDKSQNTMEIPVVNVAETKAAMTEEIPDDIKDGFFHNSKNKSRVWLPIFISSMIVIITCITLFASYITPILKEHGMFGGMAKIITPMLGAGEPPKNVNVLLVGTDRGGYRTDTMMIASYDNAGELVHVMQIPRDTYVGNNGRRDKKVNSAFFSGIDQLKHEIDIAYGIKIHKYLAVELDGFVQMVDKLGGVEIDVPINMNYDDPTQNLHIHLKKGYQLLDGSKAEQFVRFRKNNDGTGYPMGDIDRMEAQKKFIMALIQKTISMNGLSKISELISIAQQNIKTDLVYDEAYSYVSKLLSIDKEKILFHEAPGEMEYKYNGWYFFVDNKGASEMAAQYFNGDKNIAVSATRRPAVTPKEEPKHIQEADVTEDERYTYYTKTPEPKATKTPSSEDNEEDEDDDVTPTVKPSATPNGTPPAAKPTATPTLPKQTAKPTATPTITPKATQKPMPTATPAAREEVETEETTQHESEDSD